MMELRSDPESIAPERAVVFEVAGRVDEFYEKASTIGLEFLADDEIELDPDQDFYIANQPEDKISGRLYFAMPDVRALRELVGLWQVYEAGGRMARGFGMWTQLFNLLKDVRPWGPTDRILPETISEWRRRVYEDPDSPVRFEVELWFRDDSELRARAFLSLDNLVSELGGIVLDHATITEIRYDAVLLDLPAARIRELLDDPTVTLARADEIMFIRPQSAAEFAIEGLDALDSASPRSQSVAREQPIAAILDGFPIQNHVLLADRLEIDDPDNFEEGYIVSARLHGTQMASLVLHGDLLQEETPLSRRLYVRPVLLPKRAFQTWEERTPGDGLLIDLIYRAVLRIKSGDGGEPPAAPEVVLINLSLGDHNRPFAGAISPWGRLIDYLSFRFRVLFFVSAGNVRDPVELPEFANWTEFENADPDERERALFAAVDRQKSQRTLYSPAEAMNALTIGAAHRDSAPVANGATSLDPIIDGDLPNISSALGLGYRKTIKPELLAPGGREHVRLRGTDPHLVVAPVQSAGRLFGIEAASPGPPGDLQATARTWGTSVATALATRVGHLVYEALFDDDEDEFFVRTPVEMRALIIKALLVHGTSWTERASVIEDLTDSNYIARRDNTSRYLGYGTLDSDRSVICTAERATLVGYGEIRPNEACLYRIPLPDGLEGVLDFRSLTTTLAWFSPINCRHRGYRRAALEIKPGGDEKFSIGVDRERLQPNHHAVQRGTVDHRRHVGERAAPFVDDGDLLVYIAARPTAGEFDGVIPYALAVSLEVEVGSEIRVYDEVRAAVEARIRPAISP